MPTSSRRCAGIFWFGSMRASTPTRGRCGLLCIPHDPQTGVTPLGIPSDHNPFSLLMQVELRAEDEGFDCCSAGRRNVRNIRRGRFWQQSTNAVAFRWVRIPHLDKKKCRYPKGYLHFLADNDAQHPNRSPSVALSTSARDTV